MSPSALLLVVRSKAARGVAALLPLVDAFLPKDNRILALSSQPNVETAATQLSCQRGHVGLKLGARGTLAP